MNDYVYGSLVAALGAAMAIFTWNIAVQLNLTNGKKTWKEAGTKMQALLLGMWIGVPYLVLHSYLGLY